MNSAPNENNTETSNIREINVDCRYIITNLPMFIVKLCLSIISAIAILAGLVYISVIIPNLLYSIESLRIETVFGYTALSWFIMLMVAFAVMETIINVVKDLFTQ